jgi:putative membrane protein
VTVVIWIFALLAAAIHIVVFVFEALLIQRPGIHWGVFKVPSRDVPAIRLWAFGVGFYNLFLGIGMVAGVIAWIAGYETAGKTLVIYLCLVMFFAGVVLFIADRLALSRPRGADRFGPWGQAGPPLIALVAALLWA